MPDHKDLLLVSEGFHMPQWRSKRDLVNKDYINLYQSNIGSLVVLVNAHIYVCFPNFGSSISQSSP